MSGSLPPGRQLRWRVGRYPSARRQTAQIGSTCTVIFELVDTATGLLVPADGLSAICWRPRLGGFASRAVPLFPVLLAPGRWQADFEAEMTGLHAVPGVTIGAGREAVTAYIDVKGGPA